MEGKKIWCLNKSLQDLLQAAWPASGAARKTPMRCRHWQRGTTAGRLQSPSSLVVGHLLCVPHPGTQLFPSLARPQTQPVHTRNGSPTRLTARALETGPHKSWWSDPIRSASWGLGVLTNYWGDNDTARKEFEVLLIKTVEELFERNGSYSVSFYSGHQKKLDLSTSIHLFLHIFLSYLATSDNYRTRNLVYIWYSF